MCTPHVLCYSPPTEGTRYPGVSFCAFGTAPLLCRYFPKPVGSVVFVEPEVG